MFRFIKNLLKDSIVGFLIMLLMFGAAYFSWVFMLRSLTNQIEREFSIVSEKIISEINDRVESYADILSAARGLFGASDFVSREEWSQFIASQKVLENYGAIKALEYVSVVKNEDKDDFIEQVRADGITSFDIFPPSDKNEYFVVSYIEPYEGNEKIFGFDLSSEQSRLEALELSRNINDFVLTAPVDLVQDNEIDKSFLAIMPIYKNGVDTLTLEQRMSDIQGFVVLVFKVDNAFSDIIDTLPFSQGINFDLSDGDNHFYSQGDISSDVDFIYRNRFEIGNRIWIFESHATKSFSSEFTSQRNLILLISISIALFGFLLFVIFYLVNRSGRASKELALKMTKNFNEEKRKVENTNKELKSTLSKLKKSEVELEKQLEESSKLNKLMVGRELKMIELKKKIEEKKK